jgi:hypothetical protein
VLCPWMAFLVIIRWSYWRNECPMEMKKTFKYFLKSRKSTKKYGHLSPFWEKDSTMTSKNSTISFQFNQLVKKDSW